MSSEAVHGDVEGPAVRVLAARAARGVRRAQEHGPAGIAPSPVVGVGYPWLRTGSVDVEILVNWAFGAQRVGEVDNPASGLLPIEAEAAGFHVDQASPDGCYAIGQRQLIGADIDVSRGPSRRDYHPAALAVLSGVATCSEGRLVKQWAMIGSRPDGWREPERWIVPRQWKVEGEAGEWQHTGANGKSQFTPVTLARSAATLALARMTYATWHRALVELWLSLSTRALGFVVMPPGAPAEPWAGGRTEVRNERGPAMVSVTMASSLARLIGDDMFDTVTAAAVPTLALYVAPWCMPSRAVLGDIDAVARSLGGIATVAVVDVTQAQTVAVRAELAGLPAMVLYRSGRIVADRFGSMSRRGVRSWVIDALDA